MIPTFHLEDLPKTLRISGYTFRLELMHIHTANSRSLWGECSVMEQYIRLLSPMPTAFKAVDTLLHEVGHAIWWAYGLNEKLDNEERIVAMQATAWMAFWRDNSRVLDWIQLALAQGEEEASPKITLPVSPPSRYHPGPDKPPSQATIAAMAKSQGSKP